MRVMFTKLRNVVRWRCGSDKGDSELVSLLILLPLLLAMLISIIDSSMYFANRSQVQAAARDGARQVAIMGGAGNTPIEKAYGSSCDPASLSGTIADKAYKLSLIHI